MTPGSAARRSASMRGTRRSLWEDIEAVGKQATSLTPLIEVLAVSRQAEAANSTAPPPNLVVPKEFNFGGSIASTIAKPEVSWVQIWDNLSLRKQGNIAQEAQNFEVRNLGRVTIFLENEIPSIFFFLGTMRNKRN